MRRGVAASVALSLLAGTALADSWIVDKSNGCGTSNPFPKPNESISWRGGCRDGKLDGQGTLIWYRDGVETERDQGGFKAGELEGEAVITYPDGHTIIGRYREGQRDGEFIVTKPNGQVTVNQYNNGKFLSERQLTAAEAAARAPEIAARRRQFGDPPATRTASGPALPARPRATPEPVNAPPPRPTQTAQAAPVLIPPAAPVPATPAPPAPAPVSSLPPIGPSATPATPPPLPALPPIAATQPPGATGTPPPSRARAAAQPPSPAPSATMAPDLRPVLPPNGERIVLRPPKPRSAARQAADPVEPVPPPNRARAIHAAGPRTQSAPIVLRPPRGKPVPSSGGSVWIDEAVLPPPGPGVAGRAPVLRPPGSPRPSAQAPRLQPVAQLAPAQPRMLPPLPPLAPFVRPAPPPIYPVWTTPVRPAVLAPALRPPPLTPTVMPSPLTQPSLPTLPATPTRPGAPSARAEPVARYALSLSNADLPQAARAILADALGERFSIDPGVTANVTLTPAAPLGRDELVQAFRQSLLVQGVELARDGTGWRIARRAEAGAALPQLAARVDSPGMPLPAAPSSDAESRFVAGFGLERSGRKIEAMQTYNALIAAHPDSPSAALARERLAGMSQAQARAAAPAPLGARSRIGQYLCTAPGLFGAGSLWCGQVRGEDAGRYEIEIRRVSVGGVFSIGFSRAPCTGDTFISQLSIGNRVVVPKGCMAP